MFKRIFLFLIVNVLVITTISIVTTIFGIGGFISQRGINYSNLIVYCLVWGMGGAFISLLLSRVIAKMAMGVNLLDTQNPTNHSDLVEIVIRLSQRACIPMPQVGIYESPEINAFATGPSKKRSLVAVSTGMLQKMNSQELEGVLGHEISHIANGDMVTMTLIQGVVNAFTMFLSRAIAFAVGQLVKEEISSIVRIVLTIILDIALSILGTFVVAYFSRNREYKADYDSAKIAGKNNMVAALEGLKNKYESLDNRGQSLATLKISNKSGFLKLLSTHPPLEDRIEALKRSNLV